MALVHAASNMLTYALDAHQRGWSIIPLRGGDDPATGKRPLGRWQQYTRQCADQTQLLDWFSGERTAYGVICGGVSGLIVIDFDDCQAQAEFARRFPHLLKTHIVRSGVRGTLHIYLSVDYSVASCRLRGGDLKAEGGYVVGAGSRIAGQTWELVSDLPPRQIGRQELDDVLHVFTLKPCRTSQRHLISSVAHSPNDFIANYQRLALQLGSRNEALFRTGCAMRDAGFDLAATIGALVHPHAQHPAIQNHHAETERQRKAEAMRTLQSVFSRSARSPQHQNPAKRADASYVPNALREKLLRLPDGVAFLRVYEGLMLVGKQVGDTIRERQACELLRPHGVGRPAIRAALQFRGPAATSTDKAESDKPALQIKTCGFVPATKPDKNTRGRPAQHHIIPTIEALCATSGVEDKGADPITLPDIQSPAVYRAALHRELIRRRPGIYSQAWLGRRLHVTPRTIQRYNQHEGIQSRQTFETIRITWSNLNQIPASKLYKRAGLDAQPYFLQDGSGRRYPPQKGIAQKLLCRKQDVWLTRRSLCHYVLAR